MTEHVYETHMITCDVGVGCGEWHRGINPDNLHRLLRGWGWVFTPDGRHYCPDHHAHADTPTTARHAHRSPP